jgi:hypothetical protein
MKEPDLTLLPTTPGVEPHKARRGRLVVHFPVVSFPSTMQTLYIR